MSKMWLWTVVVLVAAGMLAACGGQATTAVSYDVKMSEYTYSPDLLEVKVGQEVTLKLVNTGVVEHELMIGRNLVREDGRPNGYEQDLFVTAGVEPQVSGSMPPSESADEHMHGNPGVMVTLPAGEAGSIKFVATEDMVGEWEMGCFSQDGVHYTAGMVGRLVVQP